MGLVDQLHILCKKLTHTFSLPELWNCIKKLATDILKDDVIARLLKHLTFLTSEDSCSGSHMLFIFGGPFQDTCWLPQDYLHM